MKKEVISFKIDSELKKTLQELADRENRSLSNYIVTVLLRHVESYRKNPSEGQK